MQIVSSGVETICMKCQTMFSGKSKTIIIKSSSAEFTKKAVKVEKGTWHACSQHKNQTSLCIRAVLTDPLAVN